MRSLRTRLLFKTGLKPTKLQEGITFSLMQALNLRTLCDLTVFAIPVFVIPVVYHDTMHHNIASILIALTISRTKRIYSCSVLQIMAYVRRNTIQISFAKIPSQLKELASRVSKTSTFTKRHGQLLNLVTSNIDEKMLGVLFQFFDPKHHCFTFPDYQLVPTLEEFS